MPPPRSALVECPCCGRAVPEPSLNMHLDTDCKGGAQEPTQQRPQQHTQQNTQLPPPKQQQQQQQQPQRVEPSPAAPLAPVFLKPAGRVALVRHGRQRFYGAPPAMREDGTLPPEAFDPPLTAEGHAQAQAARAALCSEGFHEPTTVIVSPLTRAIQTALGCFGEAFAAQGGLTVCPTHSEHVFGAGDVGTPASELVRRYEALPGLRDSLRAELAERWWFEPAHNCRQLARVGRRESNRSLRGRVGEFRRLLARRVAAGERVVVVGHSTFFMELTGTSTRMAHGGVHVMRV